MSINLIYKTSGGKEYNLKSDGIKTKEANFHSWSWNPNGIALTRGFKVSAFTKEAATYETSLHFRGPIQERIKNIDDLHSQWEREVVSLTPGRIIWGGWYIECYMTSSSTYPDEDGNTVNDVEIYCPNPFWRFELSRTFLPKGNAEMLSGLDYPHDFPFDFAGSSSGRETWNIDHNLPMDFKMTIYGPCTYPAIIINDHTYSVLLSLNDDEYAIINSEERTIYKYSNGTRINMYDLQYKQESVFEEIQPGLARINWSGTFGFDLTLFMKASEPRWTTT